MVKIPTDEQIDLVISELQTGSEMIHSGREDHGAECEMCQYMKEMQIRGRDEPTAIDKISLAAGGNPGFLLASVITGSLSPMSELIKAVRTAFFVGYKVGLNEASLREINSCLNLLGDK